MKCSPSILSVVVSLLLSACTLPESKDIDNGTVSITMATATGAVHVLLACPSNLPPIVKK